MPDVVLAVDPGLMTGWVLWEDGKIIEQGQNDFDSFCLLVDAMFVPLTLVDKPTEIVVERYDVTAETLRKSRQYEALYLIGVLRYIALREDIIFYPSQRSNKAFATDDRLRAAGWLSRPKTERRHENDAKRHLLTRLIKTKRMEVPRGTTAP
jgi:hypothetical protein